MNLVETYTSQEWQMGNKDEGLVKTIIVGKDGIYEKENSWLGSSIKKVNNYGVATYPEIKEELEVKKVDFEKIPKEAIIHVMEWYRQVQADTGEEAQINFYRKSSRGANADGTYTLTYKTKETVKNTISAHPATIEYEKEVTKELKDITGIHFWGEDIFSYTPKQKNSGSLTSAVDPIYDSLNQEYGMYVETHSHNSMAAFRSGTDEANSWNEALQLVFGHFGTNEIEMYDWITVRGKQEAGLSQEIIEYFVELPDGYYNQDESKMKFSTDILVDIDQDLIDLWDSQIIPKPPVRTVSYGQFGFGVRKAPNYSSIYNNSWDDWDSQFERVTSTSSKVTTYKSSVQKITDAVDAAFEMITNEDIEAWDIADAYAAGVRATAGYVTYAKGSEEEMIEKFYYDMKQTFLLSKNQEL